MPRCSITCRPSSSGRIAAQLLLGGELDDARLEVVHPLRQPRRLALVACRAVAARQHVELVEQVAGVAHVPPHGRVAPPHLVGVEAQVQEHQLGHRRDVGRRVPQGLHARCASCGPRRRRGGGTSCPCRAGSPRVRGLPMSWNSAARRVTRKSKSPSARSTFSTTAMVWLSTSLWRWIGSCSRRSAGSSGRKCSASPVSTRNHRPAAGASTTISLSARRGSARPTRSPAGRRDRRTAATSSGTGVNPKRAMKRAARSIRSGSSSKLISGDERGAQGAPYARSTAPPYGSTSTASLRRASSAIALIVKSRRARSVLDGVGERDLGLAGVVVVALAAERRDLDDQRGAVGAVAPGTDRPEPLALGPHRVGPPAQQLLDRRPGRASVVRSRSPATPSPPTSRSRTAPPTRYSR